MHNTGLEHMEEDASGPASEEWNSQGRERSRKSSALSSSLSAGLKRTTTVPASAVIHVHIKSGQVSARATNSPSGICRRCTATRLLTHVLMEGQPVSGQLVMYKAVATEPTASIPGPGGLMTRVLRAYPKRGGHGLFSFLCVQQYGCIWMTLGIAICVLGVP